MTEITAVDIEMSAQRERRALHVSKWGNLFMGAAGVLAAWVSHSQALLVDGLFSLVGFTAAIFASRVTASIDRLPDHRRPLGYAVDESLYTTFRALSLLGLVAFASTNALLNIIEYATGGTLPELRYGPIVIYFVVISLVCFGLAATHYRAWKATGGQSDVLRLEARATFFDGMMTVAAGLGLSVMPLLRTTSLGWVTPIGDSLIVLALCGIAVERYFRDFTSGLGELAGVSVPAEQVAEVRQAVETVLEGIGTLIDMSVLRFGRSFQVQAYFSPDEPISADTVDELTRTCDAALRELNTRTTTVIVISDHGRVLSPRREGGNTGSLPEKEART